MAKQLVDIGQAPNDGTGDPLRVAMDKLNDNNNEIYRSLAGLGNDTILNLVTPEGDAIQVLNVWNPISFLIDTEAELLALNPSTYHGCIAHVHQTGALYYAHVRWNKVLVDNSDGLVQGYTDPLSDIAYDGLLTSANNTGFGLLSLEGITDGTAGQVLSTNGSGQFTFSTVSGGGVAVNSFSTIAVAGQTSVEADSSSDTLTLAAGTNITLTTNATTDTVTITSTAPGFSPARVTQAVSTPAIADNASANISFANLGISYALYNIEVDYASRVRIYSDVTSRTNDASRPIGTDPLEGEGVIAEFISSGPETFKITPAIYGFVDNSETSIPVSVTNLAGSTYAIEVTLTGLKLEDA